MPQVYIVNVFANASHPFVSPLFADSTFELVPIPERPRFQGKSIERYRDLKCFNSDAPLTRYLPNKSHRRFVHDDPDLTHMTYGDVMNPRSALLERVTRGDWVAFYALLTPLVNAKPVKKERAFYIVAAFQVDRIIKALPNLSGSTNTRRKFILQSYGRTLGRRILENAHTRRWLVFPRLNNTMRMIIVGGRRSKRFTRPLSLDRALCEACFRDKNGDQWNWKKAKTQLQTIGSYLRSVRMARNPDKLLRLFLSKDLTRAPRLYSYIVAKDAGFAPCVTKALLSLACCKPKIRSSARPGDWVMGTTPKKRGSGKLVFLARITQKLSFSEYHHQVSKNRRDNIYRPKRNGGYVQTSTRDHGPKHKKKDVSTDAVLLSKDFGYYGADALSIPGEFLDLVASTQGHRRIQDSRLASLLDWARQLPWGVQGKPADREAC